VEHPTSFRSRLVACISFSAVSRIMETVCWPLLATSGEGGCQQIASVWWRSSSWPEDVWSSSSEFQLHSLAQLMPAPASGGADTLSIPSRLSQT
jgi:hypothetical protein